MSTKRPRPTEVDSTSDGRHSKTAKPTTTPLKIYIVMSKSSSKHDGKETKMRGLYTCLATANNVARRLNPAAEELNYDDIFGTDRSGVPFSCSYMEDKSTRVEVWVSAHIVNETIEDDGKSEGDDEDES